MSCENGSDQLPDRRIGELIPKDQKLTSVYPDDSLECAISIMKDNDYSQLPVTSSEDKPEGIITWESIGKRAFIGDTCDRVSDCMDTSVKVACFDDHLLEPTENIAKYGYILVMGDDDRTIEGIVTASDLAKYFGQFAERFLAIEEIEFRLRKLIDSKFTDAEKLSADGECHCGRVTLTLGKYPRLLDPPEHWNRLGLDISYEAFAADHKPVPGIRNSLVHFDNRELKPEGLKDLHKFLSLLRGLE